MQRLLFTYIFTSFSIFGFGQVASNFSSNAEGWTTPNDADATITYNATGGNPGGYVSGTPFAFVSGSGTIYFPFHFNAPAVYLGNKNAYFDGTLRFDLQQSTTAASVQQSEVILTNNAGISIYYFPAAPFQPPAAPTWTTFSVTLNENAGFWKTTNSATGTAATETQIRNVLSDLATFQIRGLFRNANTTGRLDNVTLMPPIIITTQPSSTAVCEGLTATFTTLGTNNPGIGYQWQRETSPSVWNNVVNGSGFSGAITASLSINTTGNVGAGNYRCLISGTAVDNAFTSIATLTVNALPTAPGATGAASCSSPASLTLTATGGTAGQYRWYTVPTGGTAIASQTNSTYTTPSLTLTTNYYVSINNGTCESTRTIVTATISTPPIAPTTTGGSSCASGSVTLNASGGAAGQYRWYTVPTGGTAIAGEVNSTYVTPSLTTTTSYYVSINNGTCESVRTSVTATITVPPSAPTTTGATGCSPATTTLNASGGTNGQYRWYAVATGGAAISGEVNSAFTTPILTTTTTYYVSIHNGTCESSRTSVTATIQPCVSNQPPSIAPTTVQTAIEGKVTVNLTALLSDPDNNLDLSTLKVIVQPLSGAKASIDAQRNLILDYKGISFSGKEKLTLEVCDLLGACSQKEVEIDVAGDVVIYNGMSPNGDMDNDFFYIQYIDVLETTKKNHVFIYNRWGDLIFDVSDYDNKTKVFKGLNNNGNEIPSGTYFYKIVFTNGRSALTGYLEVKR